MITLIVTVMLGLGFALFATQNTGVVTLNFGHFYLPDIPIYLVTLIPLLIGLFAAFLIYVTRDISAEITTNKLGKENSKLKEENTDFVKQIHKLELENVKLKSKNGEKFDEDSI